MSGRSGGARDEILVSHMSAMVDVGPAYAWEQQELLFDC